MDYAKPVLVVISGPDAAGKSTHIQTMLPPALAAIRSFDRDNTRIEYEKELQSNGIEQADLFRMGTEMMEQKLVQEMIKAVHAKDHFVLETPLSHSQYWSYLDLFEKGGYQVQLNYLCLDKVSDCVARVGQRVLQGGHYVPPGTIKGVYEKNLEHINEYKRTFQVIELYDGMKVPTLLVRIEDNIVTYASRHALKKNWIILGLPSLAADIRSYLAQF